MNSPTEGPLAAQQLATGTVVCAVCAERFEIRWSTLRIHCDKKTAMECPHCGHFHDSPKDLLKSFQWSRPANRIVLGCDVQSSRTYFTKSSLNADGSITWLESGFHQRK